MEHKIYGERKLRLNFNLSRFQDRKNKIKNNLIVLCLLKSTIHFSRANNMYLNIKFKRIKM